MTNALRILLQIILYAAFAVVIGWLSILPPFHYASANMATVKLSLSHATTVRKTDARRNKAAGDQAAKAGAMRARATAADHRNRRRRQ